MTLAQSCFVAVLIFLMPMANPRALSRLRRLARLLALPLHARQAMLGSVSGNHRSPVRGSSLEFAQYRKYVPGDDTRRLDWRTWGRSDRFYIKEFEADTNLRLCLLFDTSGSMGYGPAGKTRLDYAKRLGGTLGYLAAQQGDGVGLWTLAEKPTNVPAKRGAAHLGVVMDQLDGIKPTGGTTLIKSLHDAAEQIRQRALVVVFSDLFVATGRTQSPPSNTCASASTTWPCSTCWTSRNSTSISTGPRASWTWKAAKPSWPILRSSRATTAPP